MPKSSLQIDRYLKPLVVVLIVLACGPELFAVIELTTLLELLGATLFLFAFATSFKLLAFSMLDCLRKALLPREYTTLVGMRAWPSAAAAGLFFLLVNGLAWFVLCLTPYLVVSSLLTSV